MKKTIHTDQAPQAIGHYSQAIEMGNTIWCSGQIPLNPETRVLVEGDFKAQVRQVFKNLTAVIDAAGASLDDVVKFTVYLVNLDNYAELNEVFSEFVKAPYAARALVPISGLPLDAQVEIDAVIIKE